MNKYDIEGITNEELFRRGEYDRLYESSKYILQRFVNIGIKIGLSKEDAISDVNLIFTTCLSKYKENTYMWTTYLFAALKPGITRYTFRKLRATKRKIDKSVVSLEATVAENSEGKPITLSDVLQSDSTLYTQDIILDRILTLCNKTEKDIILLSYKGYKQQDIANILGISQSRVSRSLRKIYRLYEESF